jgi:hypothetical protein
MHGNWTLDIAKIASELIAAYRDADIKADGDQSAIMTMNSWQALAQDRGDEFTEADWLALVQELAQRCARGEG